MGLSAIERSRVAKTPEAESHVRASASV